jgi:uncharacterized protein YciI
MKHFIVEVTYLQPLEQVLPVRAEHRAFLQIGYDKGWLLCSGAQSPVVGGMVVARAPSLEDLQAFFAQDPYKLKGLASYRFVEFTPAGMQSFMADWFNPA